MSQKIEINAEVRTDVGKGASRRLRRSGNSIPGIIYGAEEDPVNLTLNTNELSKAMQSEAFFSQILDVKFDGKSQQAVLRDLQRNPATEKVLHVDFMRISANKPIQVSVPLHFVNEDKCKGVRLGGGTISHTMNEVEISCLPADLPEFIEVYMAELDVGEIIHLPTSRCRRASPSSRLPTTTTGRWPAFSCREAALTRKKRRWKLQPKAKRLLRARKHRRATPGKSPARTDSTRLSGNRHGHPPDSGPGQSGPALRRHPAQRGRLVCGSACPALRHQLRARVEVQRGCRKGGRSGPRPAPGATPDLHEPFRRIRGPLAHFFKIPPAEILVAYDEMAFEPGVVRLKSGGGANGHNGIKSVIEGLGNARDFHRLRIGVGHPGDKDRVTPYLTSVTTPADERRLIEDAFELPEAVLEDLLDGNFQKVMNWLHAPDKGEAPD